MRPRPVRPHPEHQHADAAAGLGPGRLDPGPGLFYVRKAGRALAWIEHGAARLDGWVLVIEGRFLADPADRNRPLVTSTAELAVLLVRQALEQGLIDADTAPVLA